MIRTILRHIPRPPRALIHAPALLRLSLLLLLLLLLFLVERHFGMHTATVQFWGLSFVALLIGIIWLEPQEELLLGAAFLTMYCIELWMQPGLLPGETLRMFSRILSIGLCVWISLLRDRMNSLQLQLKARASQLRHQLAHSLQASALAHEIRQPLSVIQLRSRELLLRLEQQETADPDWSLRVEALHDAAEQLNSTIAAMASLLRSSTTAHGAVDLAAVVRCALNCQKLALLDAGVGLSCSGLEQDLLVQGDGEQLRIACGNLLRNALEALQDVAPARRRLQVALQRHGHQVWLTLADSGPGMPRELNNGPATSGKAQGMGLGLFIVRSIARHHGGRLEINRSADLGGAELRLILPC